MNLDIPFQVDLQEAHSYTDAVRNPDTAVSHRRRRLREKEEAKMKAFMNENNK